MISFLIHYFFGTILDFAIANQKTSTMKSLLLFFAIFIALTLSSCGVVDTIFKAGMVWAFILVGLVVAIIIFIVAKTNKK